MYYIVSSRTTRLQSTLQQNGIEADSLEDARIKAFKTIGSSNIIVDVRLDPEQDSGEDD